MIHVIYLAAGQSRRYGANKLLSIRNGKALYRHGLDTIIEAMAGREDFSLTVVTCWMEVEEELLHKYEARLVDESAKIAKEHACDLVNMMKDRRIRVVRSPDSYLGISYSIRAGILSLLPLREQDYLCFAVADQPFLQAETITMLWKTADVGVITACLEAAGETGNPVLFHGSLVPELLALEGDKGGKSVMQKHPEGHVTVLCDPKELQDIDVPMDEIL